MRASDGARRGSLRKAAASFPIRFTWSCRTAWLLQVAQLEGVAESAESGSPYAIHGVGGHELNDRKAVVEVDALKLPGTRRQRLARGRVAKCAASTNRQEAACSKRF